MKPRTPPWAPPVPALPECCARGRFALYLAGEPYKSGLKAQGCGKLKKAVFSIELDPDEEETEK